MLRLIQIFLALFLLAVGPQVEAGPASSPAHAAAASASSSPSQPLFARAPIPPQLFTFVVLGGSYSHLTAPLEYAKELARRGHKVDFLSMAPELEGISGATTKKYGQSITTVNLGPYPPHINATLINGLFDTMCAGEWWQLYHIKQQYFDAFWEESYAPMLARFSQKEHRPSLLLIDMFATSAFDVALKLNIPFVVLVDTGLGIFGAGEWYDIPSMFNQHGIEMNFFQRFHNFFLTTPQIIYRFVGIEDVANKARARHGLPPTLVPSDRWLGHEQIFVSSWAFDWARTLPPYMHLVGPIWRTEEEIQPLTNAYTTFLAPPSPTSSYSSFVIYLALGSRAGLSSAQKQTLLDGILNCADPTNEAKKLRLIWAGDDAASLPAPFNTASPSQLLASKWHPQLSLLSSGSISLFINHGGISSIQESMLSAVPLLILPFFGDQWLNSAKLADAGVAASLDKRGFTKEEVCGKIRFLLTDARTKENLARVSRLNRYLGNGNVRGADIIERAAYVGSAHLFPRREQVHPLLANYIDCWAALVAFLGAVFWALRKLCRALCCRRQSANGNQNKQKLG